MLKEWKELDKPGEEELKLRLDAAKEKLARQQLLIKEQKRILPNRWRLFPAVRKHVLPSVNC